LIQEETSVDQEVHATAGQEASATCFCSDQQTGEVLDSTLQSARQASDPQFIVGLDVG